MRPTLQAPGALGSLARASIRVLLGPLAQCSASGPRASLSLESVAVLGGPVAPQPPHGPLAPGPWCRALPGARRPFPLFRPRRSTSVCPSPRGLLLCFSLAFPAQLSSVSASFCGATPAPPHPSALSSLLLPSLASSCAVLPRFAFFLRCFFWLSSFAPSRFLGPGPSGPLGRSGPGALRPSGQLAPTDGESVRGPRPR